MYNSFICISAEYSNYILKYPKFMKPKFKVTQPSSLWSGWQLNTYTLVFLSYTLDPYMVTISTLLAPCEGNSSVTGGFPSQRASNPDLRYFLQCEYLFNTQSSCQWLPHDITFLLSWHCPSPYSICLMFFVMGVALMLVQLWLFG